MMNNEAKPNYSHYIRQKYEDNGHSSPLGEDKGEQVKGTRSPDVETNYQRQPSKSFQGIENIESKM
jgi:hypothetical protein